MGTTEELDYSSRDVRRFLPLGWSLADDAGPGWDAERGAWLTTVRDGSDLDWEVSVKAEQAATLGRDEALRRALLAAMRRF